MDKNTILRLLDSGDTFQASDKLMKILMNRSEREKLFKEFLAVETDQSYDWFSKMYSDEMAEKTKKKQYFTPPSIANLITQINSDSIKAKNNFDSAAGTGALTVANWNNQRNHSNFFTYRPSDYFYVAEELKIEGQPSRALPFLLFNFLIRGMNGVVINGDSLSRKVSQIYFIQNDKDDCLAFSSLNVMPRTETVAKEFDVRGWIDEPIDHIEDIEMPRFLKNIQNAVDKK